MLHQLHMAGIIPVIKIEKAQDAVPVCRALADGGLPVAEITFRTQAAAEAIQLVKQQLPDMLLGAGTVLTAAQADEAIKAGAAFIVSPGFNNKVVRHCLDKGMPVLPGCASPTEMEMALDLGLEAVKFFPAEALGGTAMIKALLGPYPQLRFVPTGGVNAQNLLDYLSIPQVLACGGSWMVPPQAIAQQDWARIARLTRQAVDVMLGMELRHIGINHADADQADQTAHKLAQLMGCERSRDSALSCFVGDGFEVMKIMGRGQKAHLALAVNHLPRARWHLKRRGFTFDEDSLLTDEYGQPRLLYLTDEIAGFAIHLLQK